MSDEPSVGADAGPEPDSGTVGHSAPWERPRRWNQQRLEATRVDDLLARLGTGDTTDTRRSRRRADDTETTVAASELIAALQPTLGTPSADPAAPQPDGSSPVIDAPGPTPPLAAETAPAVAPTPSVEDTTPPAPPVVPVAEPALATAAATVAVETPTSPERTEMADQHTDLEEAVLLTHPLAPPRAGPGEAVPLRDLSDGEEHTEIIPKISGHPDQAASIRESLRLQSGAAPAAAVGAGVATATPERPPRRQHHPWLFAARAVVAVVTVLALVTVGLYWNIYRRAGAQMVSNQVTAIDPSDTHIVRPTAAPVPATTAGGAAAPPAVSYQAENLLLLGSDTRAGNNGNASNSNATTAGGVANSDTLMIAHLSADRQHVTILSIPRDTMIPAPTCKTWDSTTGKVSDQTYPVSPGDTWHINSAYSVGGPKCTVTAVQALTGLEINRVIGIDFSGFKAMVDALGGIQVNICRPIVDAELGTVVPQAGNQRIEGTQALNLVRSRSVIGETGSDLARIHRQQVVLSAILRQVTAAGTLLNPHRLDTFLQAFTKNTFTDNVTLEELVTIAGSLGNLEPSRVTFYTLPTIPSDNTPGALQPDPSKAPQVFTALINDHTLPGQTTAPVTPPSDSSTSRTVAPTGNSGPAGSAARPSTPATTPGGTDLASVNAGDNLCA